MKWLFTTSCRFGGNCCDFPYLFKKEHGVFPANDVNNIFPAGGISIKLVFEDGEEVVINDSDRAAGWNKFSSIEIVIYPTRQTKRNFDQENKKIVKMYIKSSKTIENAELSWNNMSL